MTIQVQSDRRYNLEHAQDTRLWMAVLDCSFSLGGLLANYIGCCSFLKSREKTCWNMACSRKDWAVLCTEYYILYSWSSFWGITFVPFNAYLALADLEKIRQGQSWLVVIWETKDHRLEWKENITNEMMNYFWFVFSNFILIFKRNWGILLKKFRSTKKKNSCVTWTGSK